MPTAAFHSRLPRYPPPVRRCSSTGAAGSASLVGVSFLFHLQLDAAGFGLLSNATQFQLLWLRDLAFVLEASFQIEPAQTRSKITSMDSGFYDSPPAAVDMGGCVSNRAVRDTIGWATLRAVILPSSDPQFAYIDDHGNAAVNITDILNFQSALTSSLSGSAALSSVFCAASFRNVLLHQLSNVSDIEIVPVYPCPSTSLFATMAGCTDLSNTVAAHNTGYPAPATGSDGFASWLKLLILGAIIVVVALCVLAWIYSCKRPKESEEEQNEAVEESKEQQEAAAAAGGGMAASSASSSSSNLLASPIASSPRKTPFALRPQRRIDQSPIA